MPILERYRSWKRGTDAGLKPMFLEPTFRWVITGKTDDAQAMPPIAQDLKGAPAALVALLGAGRLMETAQAHLEDRALEANELQEMLDHTKEIRERLHEELRGTEGAVQVRRALVEKMRPEWRAQAAAAERQQQARMLAAKKIGKKP